MIISNWHSTNLCIICHVGQFCFSVIIVSFVKQLNGQSHRKWDIDTIFLIMTELLQVAYQKIATYK